eukprot:215400-Ditylum_brightwellii.AAC.1
MSEEIREAKLAWLQIRAKSECSTGSSDDNSVFVEEKGDNNNNNVDNKLQDLLALNMAQTIGMLSAKKTTKKLAIELVNEEPDSESDSSDSAVVKRPVKKAKTGKVARKAKKSVEKQVEQKTYHSSVASSAPNQRKLMAQARKLLEGKTILYPCQTKKMDMEPSMFYIIQQQMKQREDNKVTREKQLLIARMECESSKRAREEQEVQRE